MRLSKTAVFLCVSGKEEVDLTMQKLKMKSELNSKDVRGKVCLCVCLFICCCCCFGCSSYRKRKKSNETEELNLSIRKHKLITG